MQPQSLVYTLVQSVVDLLSEVLHVHKLGVLHIYINNSSEIHSLSQRVLYIYLSVEIYIHLPKVLYIH